MTPPLRPDSPTAHRWLADELAKSRYAEHDWLDQLKDWLNSLFNPDVAPSVAVVHTIIAVVVGSLLAVLLVVLVRRFPRAATSRGTKAHLEGPVGTLEDPDQHRRSAAELRAAGDHAAAVVESYRALVSAAIGRGILEPAPGLTAQRAARLLSTSNTAYASDLGRAADLFDRARYARVRRGGPVITAADAVFVADLESRVAVGTVDRALAGGR